MPLISKPPSYPVQHNAVLSPSIAVQNNNIGFQRQTTERFHLAVHDIVKGRFQTGLIIVRRTLQIQIYFPGLKSQALIRFLWTEKL